MKAGQCSFHTLTCAGQKIGEHFMIQMEERAMRGSGVLHRMQALHLGITSYWPCDLGQVTSQIPHLSNGNLNIYANDNDNSYLTELRGGSSDMPVRGPHRANSFFDRGRVPGPGAAAVSDTDRSHPKGTCSLSVCLTTKRKSDFTVLSKDNPPLGSIFCLSQVDAQGCSRHELVFLSMACRSQDISRGLVAQPSLAEETALVASLIRRSINLRTCCLRRAGGGGVSASLLREFFPCIPLFSPKENVGPGEAHGSFILRSE